MFNVDREVLAAIRRERVVLICIALSVACGISLAATAFH